MASFATSLDLAERWRPLSEAEEARAAVLLDDASALLRARVTGLDDAITAGVIDPHLALIAVCAAVQRKMSTGDRDGLEQLSEQVGPFSHTFQYANPQGYLYFTAAELLDLSLPVSGATTVWVR